MKLSLYKDFYCVEGSNIECGLLSKFEIITISHHKLFLQNLSATIIQLPDHQWYNACRCE